GCGRWLRGGDVKHWVDDGRTGLDNLLLTCRPHHKLVHEFGWTVERGPDGHATFRRERPGLRSGAARTASRGATAPRGRTASLLSAKAHDSLARWSAWAPRGLSVTATG